MPWFGPPVSALFSLKLQVIMIKVDFYYTKNNDVWKGKLCQIKNLEWQMGRQGVKESRVREGKGKWCEMENGKF
jgi:hypothetical protein